MKPLNQMTTEETNAMMADFMGLKKTDENEWHCQFGNVNQPYVGRPFLRFHESWDWLIPVARKIHQKLRELDMVGWEDIENISPMDDIGDAYRTVAIFIYDTMNIG